MIEIPFRLVDKDGNEITQECGLNHKDYVKARNLVEAIELEREPNIRKTSSINEHVMTLTFMVRELNLKNILELGTFIGDSTLALLAGAATIGGHVTSVDIEDCQIARERIERAKLSEWWTFVKEDDMKFEYRNDIDLLFIDTSHLFEHTLNELKRFAPQVKNGGYIVLHDIYICPQVDFALTGFLLDNNKYVCYRWFNNNGLAIVKKVEECVYS